MFKKLNVSLDPIDVEKLKGTTSRDFGNRSGFHEFEITDYQYLYSILDKKIEFKIKPDIIHIANASVGLNPHTDHCDVSLNYYIEASNEVTVFYRRLENEFNSSSTKGWYKVRASDTVYKFEELEEIDSFVAKKHELWLLETAAIHTVKVKEGTPERSMIRCVWHKRSFDEILNSITLL